MSGAGRRAVRVRFAREKGRAGTAGLIALAAIAMVVVAVLAASAAAAKKPPLVEPQHPASCGTKPISIAFVSALANTYGQAIEKGLRNFLSTCKNVKVVDFDTG